jgi:hypothetical protein
MVENIAPGLPTLESVDWTFARAKTTYLTHGLHPYPAKYIPQIPHTLISALSHPGETVADIFCGSGTTLVESMILGRHSIGIDANPLACLISQSKTARFIDGDVELLLSLVRRSQEFAAIVSSCHEGSLFGTTPFILTSERHRLRAGSGWTRNAAYCARSGAERAVDTYQKRSRRDCYFLKRVIPCLSLVCLSKIICDDSPNRWGCENEPSDERPHDPLKVHILNSQLEYVVRSYIDHSHRDDALHKFWDSRAP